MAAVDGDDDDAAWRPQQKLHRNSYRSCTRGC